MRFGENARETIDRVKTRLAELSEGLPPGVSIVATYDRSDLIDRAVHTLTETLIEEILVVSLVVLLVPAARPQRVRRGDHAAGRRAGGAGRDVRLRHQRQHHEPGRHRHQHRRHDRLGHHHGRERPQAHRTQEARPESPGDDRRGRGGGRADAVLQPAHHHRQLPADLRARRPERAAVHAAGLHEDARHLRRGRAGGDAHPGVDDLAHQGDGRAADRVADVGAVDELRGDHRRARPAAGAGAAADARRWGVALVDGRRVADPVGGAGVAAADHQRGEEPDQPAAGVGCTTRRSRS